MQKPQRVFKDREKIAPRGARLFEILRSDLWLQPFDVPIAKISPEKVIDNVRGLVEAKFFERSIHLLNHAREAGENPSMGKGIGRGVWRFRADFRRGEFVELQASGFSLF